MTDASLKTVKCWHFLAAVKVMWSLKSLHADDYCYAVHDLISSGGPWPMLRSQLCFPFSRILVD